MSDPEVVVRLLAAIDEQEKDANERHTFACAVTNPCYEPPYESGPDYSLCDCQQRTLLRLCQAHRDIVAEWQKQKQIGRQIAAEEPYSDTHFTSDGVVAGLWAAVALVARGYGVEDGETK